MHRNKYSPFSVYSKDNLFFDEYSETIVIVFHGFLSAMPNEFYKQLYQVYNTSFTVIGYNYDYVDVKENKAQFQRFYQQALKDKTLVFAGTSLGGFWADYLGNQYAAQKIIIANPVVYPYKVLAGFQDKDNYSERRKKTIQITPEMLDPYIGLALKKNTYSRRFVLLTEDDEIQDSTIAHDYFHSDPNTIIASLSTGGHSIQYRSNTIAWAILDAFFRHP